MPDRKDYLASAMQNPEVAFQLKEALRNSLVVPHPLRRDIAEFLADFVDQHGSVPRAGDWTMWVKSFEGEKKRKMADQVGDLLDRDVSGYTPEYLAEEGIDKLRDTAAANAVNHLNGMEEVTSQDIREVAREVESVEPVTLQGIADLRNVETWAKPPSRTRGITTGVKKLDRFTGGWDTELIFVMADTGVGKSASLINFGHAAAHEGQNVFHLTLELSQRNAAQRFFRRITQSDREEFYQDPEEVQRRAENWWQYASNDGGYRLLYRDSYTISPTDLRQMVELHNRQYGEVDLILLDYLDLMEVDEEDRHRSTYEQLGRTSHKVRAIAQEYDCSVVSATQANRPPEEQYHDLNLSDIGDSYKKVQAGDIIIGLVRDEQELKNHQGRYQILKMRENPGRGEDISLYVNMDLMMIAGLDEPDTRHLMDMLGHGIQNQPGKNPK